MFVRRDPPPGMRTLAVKGIGQEGRQNPQKDAWLGRRLNIGNRVSLGRWMGHGRGKVNGLGWGKGAQAEEGGTV